MSPKVKAERFGTRNLCYSQWHRTLPHRATMIDVDGLEYCQRCRAPLAVIETARDVGQAVKPSAVLAQLARTAGIEAYVFLYTIDEAAEQRQDWGGCITGFRCRIAYHPGKSPTDYYSFTPAQVEQLLIGIHDRHDCAAVLDRGAQGSCAR